jgi:uncharacterized membrane protein
MLLRFLELIAALVFVYVWCLAALTIPTLPAHVPVHFGLNGAPDRFGSPATLWALPAIATVLYAILSLAQRAPSRFMNYPVKITDRNRDAVYALGREMLPFMKICVLLLMLAIEWNSIVAAVLGALPSYFYVEVFAPVAAIIAILAYYTYRMRKA